ncbi:MAG TPA: hypothetical protein VFH00_08800 [Candidatus Nitrosotalea sp.]|nr:hypothetical protein [Candidatus Nitrosotalea sp.]
MGRIVSGAAVVLAVAILGLMAIPATVWRHPSIDATYRGFDANLMPTYATGPGVSEGRIVVTSTTLAILALPGSHPTVHLVTTPLSFGAAFDAMVVSAPAHTTPLRIGLWSPSQHTGYFLVFDHDSGDVIRAQIIEGGQAKQDLVGGTAVTDQVLAPFTNGKPYQVEIKVARDQRTIATRITSQGAVLADTVIRPTDAPDVFNAFRPTLSVSAWSDGGASQAVLSGLVLTLPSQTAGSAEETIKIDDPLAHALVEALLAVAVALCLIVGIRRVAPLLARARPNSLGQVAMRRARSRAPVVGIVVLAGAFYLLANLPLFGVASPHFDIVAAKVWSYVAAKDGLADLYYRTVLVTASDPWQGIPIHEATFPYGVTKAYYYLAAGWIYDLWFSPAGQLTIRTFSFDVLLKSLNVLFGFADGILVYLILRRIAGPSRARVSLLLFVLNPAVILVMSVWGSTETISIFFVLGSIWLAEENRPTGAWLMLAAAAFTRPQMLVVAFLLGLVYLRKFPASRNLTSISWAVIVSWLFLAPFALSISPSVPVDYVTRILAYHIGNGQADVAYLGLSPANFSVWTLPLLFVNGQHGLLRMWSPSTLPLFGSVTYGQAGAVLSVLFVLGVGAVLFLKRNVSTQPGQYLPLVAFGLFGWLLVTPGLISRYIVYAVVAIILCRGVFSSVGYVYALAVMTVMALMSIYGHLAFDFFGYSGSLNVLSPTNNPVSGLLFSIFAADWFITLASMSNIALLIALGAKAWESVRQDQRVAVAAAPGVA